MTDTTTTAIQTAGLIWDENGLPISTQYEDFYFSKLSGLDESRYVFITHNQLTERWSLLAKNQAFTIGETGFGTGLNFLTTWQEWQKNAPDKTRLNYISVEKHPLSKTDLARSLGLWPELKELADTLVNAYPPNSAGFYRLKLTETVTLTLLFGDAIESFQALSGTVDAWFLDGFSPVKNPDMWTDALFSTIAARSKTGTTFSTFTAASLVQKGLKKAGFTIQKASGFGRKREMIHGTFTASNEEAEQRSSKQTTPGWFRLPKEPVPDQVTVIGAGIAGCSTARALANRGIKVRLLDRHPAVASEASGNHQGVLYAKLPAQPTKASRIHLSGLNFSLQLLSQLDPHYWQPCGVLQLATNSSELDKQTKLVATNAYSNELVQATSANESSRLAGVHIKHSGLWFPHSGYVSPKHWCQQLTDHPLIDVITGCDVSAIVFDESHWQLSTSQGKMTSAALVLCCADQAKQFKATDWMPTKSIRGQVSQAPFSSSPEDESKTLNCVLCGNGYVSPATTEGWNFGATFNLNDNETSVRAEDHQTNLGHITELSSELAKLVNANGMENWQGRVSFRCTSPDYLPIVGPIPDIADFAARYQALRNNAKAQVESAPSYHPNLYINIAHGSKGMITAPLASELIASQICLEPLPLEQELINALLPARFLVKKLVRKAI